MIFSVYVILLDLYCINDYVLCRYLLSWRKLNVFIFKGERSKFVKPWQSPVPPLLESVTLKVEYPTDEDEFGMVMVAWRGPLANVCIFYLIIKSY